MPIAEVSERDLVGHVTRLSHRQYSVDLGAYPLGSCTMKYNPKLCDDAAALPGLTNVHPAAPAQLTQGWLELLWSLSDALCRITGMHAGHPAAAGRRGRRADRAAAHAGLARGPGAAPAPRSSSPTRPTGPTRRR